MRNTYRSSRLFFVLLVSVLAILVGCGGDSFQSSTNDSTPDAEAGQDGSLPESGTTDAGDTDSDALTPANVVFEPQSHTFPMTLVGEQSAPVKLVVSNQGGQSSSALTLSLVGDGAGQFMIVQDPCTGEALAPFDSCTLSVAFAPGDPGPHEATLQAKAGTDVAESTITGVAATPPKLTIDPPGATFGDIAVGAASTPSAFTIENVGGLPTEPLTIAFDPSATEDFELSSDNCTGAELGANDTCTLEIVFTPKSPMDLVARVLVGFAADPGVSAELTGTGVPPGDLVISPTPATLASAVVNTTGDFTAFTLTNAGGVPIGPIAMSLAGNTPSEFMLDAAACEGETLAASSSCVVRARLQPTTSGHKTAEILAEAPGTPPAVASISAEALEPAHLVVQPTAQNFGTVEVGTPGNPYTFLVTNAGQTDSGDVLVQMQGTNADDFVVDMTESTCAGPLAPTASCTYAVVFTPSAMGSRAATLQVFSTPGGNAQAQLTGEGGDAQLSIDPSSHDFGTGVGTLVTFTVTNDGDVDTGVPQAAIQGGNPTDFIIESDQCTVPLGSGGSCTVDVRFSPAGSGVKSSSLEVSASPGGTVVAPLTGTNPQPAQLTIEPSSHDFGTVVVGGSTAMSFTIGNAGGQTTGDLTYQTGNDEFATGATDCPTQLAPGATCSLEVLFQPTSEGTKATSVEVSATPGGSVSAQLSGTGTTHAALAIAPNTHDFGNVVLQQSSDEAEFVITNTGGQTSGVLSVLLDPSAHYQVTSNQCSNQALPAGDSCSVQVVFTPTTVGDHASLLTVEAAPGGSVSATLSGAGIEPAQLSITPTSNDYGPVVDGTTSLPATFQVTNIGSDATGTIGASLSGTHANQFTIPSAANNCEGLTLGSGEFCTLEVVFVPNGQGDRFASLDVSASPGGAVSASLTGKGVFPAELAIAPSSHDFGEVAINQLRSFTFTVTNNGGVATGVVDVTQPGSPFSVPPIHDQCSGNTLPAGTSCSFDLVFAPTQGGTYTGDILVGADPGGAVTASVSAGTPDIYVSSESGSNSNDGRSWATAVATVTKGVQLAQTDWTVHVASGTYANAEAFPITLPTGVRLTGEASSYPLLTPVLSPSSPSELVVMNNPGAILEHFEIHSSSVIGGSQSLVSLQGNQTLVASCNLKCNSVHCTGVMITGDNETAVKNTNIDTVSDDCVGIDAALGTNGVTVLDNNLVWGTLPSGGSTIGMPTRGIVAGGGQVRVSNGVVTNFATGVFAINDASLRMRNVQVLESGDFGIVVNVTNLGSADLGTLVSAGLNTIRSEIADTKVGLAINSATAVDAVGNTWIANRQGADAAGHYTTHKTIPGPVASVDGNNYSLLMNSSITF